MIPIDPSFGTVTSDTRVLLSDPKNQEILASLIDQPKTAGELRQVTRLHVVQVYRRINLLNDAGLIKIHGLCRENSQKPSIIYVSLLKALKIEVTRGRVSYTLKYVDGRTEEISDSGLVERS